MSPGRGFTDERGANFGADPETRPSESPAPAASSSVLPHATRQRNPEVDKFIDHIDQQRLGQHAHTGIDGNGKEQVFICREALTDYWERDKIVNLLEHDGNTRAHVGDIETSFLETFSILCYISCSAFLNDFTSIPIKDGFLPIKQQHYSDSPRYDDAGFRDALARFCEAQWMFKPLVFENVIHRKRVAAECILPIVYDRTPLETQKNHDSAVYKVLVHPCCVGRGSQLERDVVFKMLSSSERDLWDNEVDAYTSLASGSPGDHVHLTTIAPSATVASSFKYIAMCFGNFERTPSQSVSPHHQARPTPPRPQDQVAKDLVDKTHVIILEYAPGGNLATFCKKNSHLVLSPKREDRVNLWHQMFHLLRALYSIHIIDGTHQDIKESNVLCMYENGLPDDREKVCFKLSDLGKSHFNRGARGGRGRRDKNNFGNRIYADDLEQTAPRPYTKAADIWSMGCLFSDMLVRSSLGQDGVSRYRDAREAENKQFHVPNHNPQCFHNGIERLSCVDEFHRKVLEKHPEDDVLRVVSDIILDHMLKPIRERLDDALTIRRYWENHIGARSNANSGLSTAGLSALASTVTPASPLSLPTQPLASLHRQGTLSPTITAATPTVTPAATLMVSLDTTGRPALITVRDIADFLRCRQKPWSFARSAPKVLEAFPGLRSALSVMGSRNHHFVVDSSQTMARFRSKAADTVWILAKLLKSMVRRRKNVKLSILGNQKLYPLRKSSELASIVKNFTFNHPQTSWLLGHWFQQTATEMMDGLTARSPRGHRIMKPISFYIFTDGDFGGVSPNIEMPIHNLLTKLAEVQTVMPSFFSVTIIQFRDTPETCTELRLLQQRILRLGNLPPACNAVRICPWDGDVGDMFVSGIRDSSTTPPNTIGTPAARDTAAGIPNG